MWSTSTLYCNRQSVCAADWLLNSTCWFGSSTAFIGLLSNTNFCHGWTLRYPCNRIKYERIRVLPLSHNFEWLNTTGQWHFGCKDAWMNHIWDRQWQSNTTTHCLYAWIAIKNNRHSSFVNNGAMQVTTGCSVVAGSFNVIYMLFPIILDVSPSLTSAVVFPRLINTFFGFSITVPNATAVIHWQIGCGVTLWHRHTYRLSLTAPTLGTYSDAASHSNWSLSDFSPDPSLPDWLWIQMLSHYLPDWTHRTVSATVTVLTFSILDSSRRKQ